MTGNLNRQACELDKNLQDFYGWIATYSLTRSDQISARLDYSVDRYRHETYEG